MKTIKQFSESKAAEKGERDVGSKAYTDYVTDLTPGAVTNTDAKKSDRETKKTNALKIHRATRLDDATDPEVVQANSEYQRAKDQLRKQHIKNVADIRSNKIGENLVPDPVSADAYNYKTKKGAIAAPGSGSIAKARKAKSSDLNKSIEQQMADARKEGWEELDPSEVLIEYENEEVEMEDATYSERISSDVPAGNASKARGTSKVRKYKQVTPGQVRDYEKLTAARMFQAYEDIEVDEEDGMPANNTTGVADPHNRLLGRSRSPRVYVRKRRKIDARSRDYREAIKRTQARRDATVARETEQKLNMFGVHSNPFKEETEMKNKKYLTTKEGSIEAAVLRSLTTETPVNPNDARPTLHLPNKYLASKADSLERAVTEVVTERDVSGEMRFDLKRLTGAQFRGKYRMTKSAAQTAGGGITHKGGRAVLRPHSEEVEEIDENGNHPPKGRHQHSGQKKGSAKLKKGWGMTQSGEPYFKPNSNNPTRDKKEEVEVDETHKPGHKPTQFTDPATQKMVGVKDKKGKVHTKVVKKDDPKYAKHPEHESVEMDETSKEKAGRYIQKSADSSADAAMALQRTTDKPGGQTRDDVKKHVGTLMKRRKGREMAIKKLSKEEVEIDEKDSRRTVDAIRAYDKSKDASRDADWDTEHGKKGKGDKEKKYAKKERGEIDKDDPKWKHKKGHTGMHGEEVGTTAFSSALIAATVNKIHSMEEDALSYKERQKLPSGSFALPGKGSGPEGKQGGSYPIPDASHARNALARVSQHGSEAEKATVRRAVHKKFPDIKVAESVMIDLLTLKLDETHDRSPDKSGGKPVETPDSHMGVPVKKLKPSLKGMSKVGKMMHKHREKARNEEVEINEAQSVDSAIGVIDSIVKNKQAGQIIHGDRKKSKVDLYTASAIQAVMKKASKSNQQKMEQLMSHSRQGLAKVADLSYSLVKK